MAEIRYAKSGDAHIAYQTVGDGPIDLLIVMEGFIPIDMVDDEPHMARAMRRMSSFARIIRFDRRGIGSSDPCSPAEPPTLEDWVDDAIAVLDAVGSTKAAVLSGSEASPIAILLAAAHPERVEALILVNGFARATSAPGYAGALDPDDLGQWLDDTIDPSSAEDDIGILREIAPAVADDDAFRRWWREAGRRGASPATARALLRVALQTDVRDALSLVSAPTLVLHMTRNPVAPAALGRYVAEHVAGARYVGIDAVEDFWWVGPSDAVIDEIEELLTGVRGTSEPDRVLATVLFSDIVSSTSTVVAAGDQAWRGVLDGYDALVRRQVERFGGRIVKSTGDGALATFDGPARAIRAANAIRDAARQQGLETRNGLHAGEVDIRADDIAGVAVHIAARISSIADPGEVLVSSTVRDLVAGSGIEFLDRGMHALRGVPDEWRLFSAAD